RSRHAPSCTGRDVEASHASRPNPTSSTQKPIATPAIQTVNSTRTGEPAFSRIAALSSPTKACPERSSFDRLRMSVEGPDATYDVRRGTLHTDARRTLDGRRDWQPQHEARALADRAVATDRPVMLVDDAVGNRQS